MKKATYVKGEKNFNKSLLQSNHKLISYATIFLRLGKSETYSTYQQSFLPSSSKLILYETCCCVWVKVKHIEPINIFFLKTDTTLKSNLFAKKVNSCECFVVLHLCFTYADAFINSNNLKSQKFSQRWVSTMSQRWAVDDERWSDDKSSDQSWEMIKCKFHSLQWRWNNDQNVALTFLP